MRGILTGELFFVYNERIHRAAYGEKSIATTDEVIKLACWDTAGQERYRYVHLPQFMCGI
jgi:GTPase SAR1 family protein